jgi:hypothetical protein
VSIMRIRRARQEEEYDIIFALEKR